MSRSCDPQSRSRSLKSSHLDSRLSILRLVVLASGAQPSVGSFILSALRPGCCLVVGCVDACGLALPPQPGLTITQTGKDSC